MAFVSPKQLREEIPLTESLSSQISSWRRNVEKILQGSDGRLLLIVGPCSIHNVTTALEYAEKLREVQEAVSDTFFIVMRAYFEKPRTLFGWKGLLYDPLLNNSHNMHLGVRESRFFLSTLTTLGIP